MKKLEIAMASELSRVTHSMLAGDSAKLTALLFHKDGYRILTSKSAKLINTIGVYLRSTDAISYGLIFPGSSEEEDGASSDCLVTAIVNRNGTASVHLTDYVDTDDGVVFDEQRKVIIDAPFLYLFDSDKSSESPDATDKVKEALQDKLHDYNDFIVASIGLN